MALPALAAGASALQREDSCHTAVTLPQPDTDLADSIGPACHSAETLSLSSQKRRTSRICNRTFLGRVAIYSGRVACEVFGRGTEKKITREGSLALLQQHNV